VERRQRIFAHHRLAGEVLTIAALADVDDHLPAGAHGVRETA
jgi:hypothetical protein